MFFNWLIIAGQIVATFGVVSSQKINHCLNTEASGSTIFTVRIDTERLREERKAAEPDKPDEVIDKDIAQYLLDVDEQTVQVLRNRISALGVKTPLVVPDNDHTFTIKIPGTDETIVNLAEKSITRPCYLRFRFVHGQNAQLVSDLFAHNRCPDGFEIVQGQNYYRRLPNYEELVRQPGFMRSLATFAIPKAGYVFMLEPKKFADGSTVYRPYFIRTKDELTATELKHVEIDHEPITDRIQVVLEFTDKGASILKRITTNNVGRQLAIILDDTLYSTPVIHEPLPSGCATIVGSFSNDEARLLRNILNAGLLPAPMKVLKKRTVAPPEKLE